VRLAALDGLQPYVAADERVRDAVMQALMHDPNAKVRTEAINMLQPVDSDSSVRQAMRTVSTTDDNPYIRTVSAQVLEGSPDIQ
jgi:HEAT repeats